MGDGPPKSACTRRIDHQGWHDQPELPMIGCGAPWMSGQSLYVTIVTLVTAAPRVAAFASSAGLTIVTQVTKAPGVSPFNCASMQPIGPSRLHQSRRVDWIDRINSWRVAGARHGGLKHQASLLHEIPQGQARKILECDVGAIRQCQGLAAIAVR